MVLIGINVAGCSSQQVLPGVARQLLRLRRPRLRLRAGELLGVADGEYYRLLTAAFLHGGVFHLALNMYALCAASARGSRARSAGSASSRSTCCRRSAGASLSYAVRRPATSLGVGASGAIFGLFGAYLVVVPPARRATPRSVVVLLAINLAISFTVPSIDWRAHLGGLITGALVVALVFV